MANIRLKELVEANVDPKLVARSKESGKLVYFKTPQAKDAAIKAGTHKDPKAQKDAQPKKDVKPNSMFGADYAKDRGGKAPKAAKSKYDDKSYWQDTEYGQGSQSADDDWEDDGDSWGEGPQLTSDRLNKIEDALRDELNLRDNGFETTRESGGGGGGWEGPMQIVANTEKEGYSLSIGSSNNDGTFSIIFLEPGGEEALFEPNWDALTGDNDLQPQDAYKVTKTLMKMPEVQKLLKGEITAKEFEPTYAKIKDKFSKGKTESTKLTSMIKR